MPDVDPFVIKWPQRWLEDPEISQVLEFLERYLTDLAERTGEFGTDNIADLQGRNLTAGGGLTGGGDLSSDRTFAVGAGTGITVNDDDIAVDPSAVDHDNLSGFVADEHVAHAGVSITAGNGLTGGGAIDSTRTIDVGAGTGITVSADAIATNDSAIVHDALSGFVANEHIDHTSVTLTAGAGLTGGGDISSNRSFAIDTSVVIDKSAISTYVPSNDATDRTWDANAAAGAISSTPTQAEVENIRDAVLELSDVLATLTNDLTLT